MNNKTILFFSSGLVIFLIGFMVFSFSSSDIDALGSLLMDTLTEQLKNRLEIEIQKSGAEASLAFKDLESGEELLLHTEEIMHAASLMKVPVMIEVFRQTERGKFNTEDKIPVTNQFNGISSAL